MKNKIVDVDTCTGTSISEEDEDYFARNAKRRAAYRLLMETNPTRRKAIQAANWQKYYKKNKHKLADNRTKRTKNNPKKYQRMSKRYDLKSNYDLTIEEQENMLQAQDYKCAICGVVFDVSKPKSYHTDHDHDTGKVRGILCNNCNSGLGFFKDDLGMLLSAIAYLEKQ